MSAVDGMHGAAGQDRDDPPRRVETAAKHLGSKDSDNEEAAITDAEAESKGSASPSPSHEEQGHENEDEDETPSLDIIPKKGEDGFLNPARDADASPPPLGTPATYTPGSSSTQANYTAGEVRESKVVPNEGNAEASASGTAQARGGMRPSGGTGASTAEKGQPHNDREHLTEKCNNDDQENAEYEREKEMVGETETLESVGERKRTDHGHDDTLVDATSEAPEETLTQPITGGVADGDVNREPDSECESAVRDTAKPACDSAPGPSGIAPASAASVSAGSMTETVVDAFGSEEHGGVAKDGDIHALARDKSSAVQQSAVFAGSREGRDGGQEKAKTPGGEAEGLQNGSSISMTPAASSLGAPAESVEDGGSEGTEMVSQFWCPFCTVRVSTSQALTSHVEVCTSNEHNDAQPGDEKIVSGPHVDRTRPAAELSGSATAAADAGTVEVAREVPQDRPTEGTETFSAQSADALGSERATGGGSAGADDGVEVGNTGLCPLCGGTFPMAELEAHADDCLSAMERREQEERERAEAAEKRKIRSQRRAPIVYAKARDAPDFDPSIGGGGGGRRRAPYSPTEKLSAAAALGGEIATDMDMRKCKTEEDPEARRAVSSDVGLPGRIVSSGGGGEFADLGAGLAFKGKGKRKVKAEGTRRGAGGHSTLSGESIFECPRKTKGCGTINSRQAERCENCKLTLWWLWDGAELRLGDEVIFVGDPKKPEPGFVHSFSFDPTLGTTLTFTYKNHPGYAIADLSPELLRRPPPVEESEDGVSHSGNGKASKRPQDLSPAAPVSKKHRSVGGRAGGPVHESNPRPTPERRVQDLDAVGCEHVKSGERKNYRGGKCRRCHKGSKHSKFNHRLFQRVHEKPVEKRARRSSDWSSSEEEPCSIAKGGDSHLRCPINDRRPAGTSAVVQHHGGFKSYTASSDNSSAINNIASSVDDAKSNRCMTKDRTRTVHDRRPPKGVPKGSKSDINKPRKRCEADGCNSFQKTLGLCALCTRRYLERLELKRAEARAVEHELAANPNPPPCRACEGLIEDSPHGERIRIANAIAAADAGDFVPEIADDGWDSSIRGVCHQCNEVGGKGAINQLLICDGQSCPVSMHMLCLKQPLTKVPSRTWFCETCVGNGDDIRSQRGCMACRGRDNDHIALLCDDCDDPWHMQCLPVILNDVPSGDWFCPSCRDRHRSDRSDAESAESALGGAGSSADRTNSSASNAKNFHDRVKKARSTRARTCDKTGTTHDAQPAPYDLCDSLSCTGGRPSPPLAVKTQRDVVSRNRAAVGTAAAAAVENGGEPQGTDGAVLAGVGGASADAIARADIGIPQRMTPPPAALPWTAQDEEYTRWTCRSKRCNGDKSFHEKCLLWRPAEATGRETGGFSEAEGASGGDGGVVAGRNAGEDAEGGAVGAVANSPSRCGDSGDETETDTEASKSKSCGGTGNSPRGSASRAGSPAACGGGDGGGYGGNGGDAVPMEVASEERIVGRDIHTETPRTESASQAAAGLDLHEQPLCASTSVRAEPADSQPPAAADRPLPEGSENAHSDGTNRKNSTPPLLTRAVESPVDAVLRPPGFHREKATATSASLVEGDNPSLSGAGVGETRSGDDRLTKEEASESCGSGLTGSNEAFGSLEREFELEDQATTSTASARIETTVSAVGGSATAGSRIPEAKDVVEAVTLAEGGEETIMGSERGNTGGGRNRVGMNLVCPQCMEVVATPEEIVKATNERVKFRGYTAALGRAFRRGFPYRSCREDVECSDGVKGAKKTGRSVSFMYGSICDQAVDCMFRECELEPTDRFLDIGSGIGQVVMQAAACIGCYAVGVEIVPNRHRVAQQLLEALIIEAETEKDPKDPDVKLLDNDALRRARLIEGNFVDKWDLIQDCNVIYINNYGRWFKFDDPEKAEQCFEAQLIRLLQALDHPITLITMAPLFREPMTWTRRERRNVVGERVATYLNQTELIFYIYTTHHGQWKCPKCMEANEGNVDMCRWCGLCTRTTRSSGRI